MLRVIYLPEAEAELLEAVPFYGSRDQIEDDLSSPRSTGM